MYEKIQNEQPNFPEKFDPKAKDLILKLLDKNSATRLGHSDVKYSFFLHLCLERCLADEA
jgi:hypothetical protein